MTYVAVVLLVALRPSVDVVEGEEPCLLTCLCVDGITLLHICLNQLVAPPCEPHVLGLQIAVVGAAEVQVFECKQFILRSHGCWGC